MNTKSIGSGQFSVGSPCQTSGADMVPAAARMMFKLLAGLQHGALAIKHPDGRHSQFGDASHPARTVTVELKNWRICDAVMKSGDIGLAETYIDGDWRTDNLPGLIELMIRNRAALESLLHGAWWGKLLYRMRHLLNRNSRAGSRKNIHAHYDIGNAFYRLWLDRSMTYSSALYDPAEACTLAQAQHAKYRRILDQLAVAPGANILEIGCGWGAFAETAILEAGAKVTGLTLSTEQLRYAKKRLAKAGIAQHADLQLCDYRDSSGAYDAVASIEMFEAVGEAYWPDYFECVARSLKKNGRACIQTIVIADELFDRYRTGTDFIQQYIFPGGMLPSPAIFRRHAEQHGLRLIDQYMFGPDYARTLAAWKSQFHDKLPQVRELGFDEKFIRTWDFYLGYCEGGFRAGSISVAQFTLEKT